MPHFACAARFGFAIQMHKAIHLRQYARPIGIALCIIRVKPHIPQNIQHHRRAMLKARAQRQSGHCTHLLFKLTGQAGILRVMPRIMRTRRHFVRHQRAILQNKKLNTQHAHIAHRLSDFLCGLLRRRGQFSRRTRCWHRRGMQNPITMHVLRQRIVRHVATPTTREQGRDLKSQRQTLLQYAWHLIQLRPRRRQIIRCFDRNLSFTVIAQTRRF